MMKNIYLLIFGLCVIISCNTEKKREDALYKEVMDIHDEVMPEMGKLRALSKSLQLNADSIMQDSTQLDPEELVRIDSLIKRLERANESMLQWMRDFEPLEEGTPHGEVLQFLIEQKKRIDKVKEDMLKAKDEADKYLKN